MATDALREVFARFGVDFETKELEKGIGLVDSMVGKLKGFAGTVAAAFAVSEIVEFGKELINQADHVGETAERLDVGTTALQQWLYAAKLSGVETDALTGSVQRLGAGLAEAAAGKGQAATFKKLGVGLKNADGTLKSSIQVFEEAGLAIGALQDPTEAAGYASDLFGKQYARLLPLFRQGPAGLAALRKEFEELGGGFSPEFIKQSEEVNDNIDRLKFGLRGFAVEILSHVLPAITELTVDAVKVVRAIATWVKSTKLIKAALIALTGFGLSRLRDRMALLLVELPKVIARFGGLRAILARLAMFVLRFIAPLLILEDILVFLAGGKSAIGKGLDAAFGPGTAKNIQNLVAELVKFFGLFKAEPDKVRASFATLPDDLAKELGGFGRFLGGWGQEVVNVGLFVTNALTGGWANFVAKAKAGGQGILLALKIVCTELAFLWVGAAAQISDAFDSVWNGIIKGAQAALSAMLDVLAKLPGTDDMVKTLRLNVEALGGGKRGADAVANFEKFRDNTRLALAAEGDRIGAVATAPASLAGGNTNVTNNTEVHVVVPAGTDADVARGVGKAAEKGAARGTNLRATKAALVPTAGS